MAERRPDRTLGPAHDDFWHWCAQEQLRLQRCGTCGHLAWPVTHSCEVCGGGDLRWERMSGKARLISWSMFEKDYYAGLMPLPYINILVELEEGPLFLSNPKGLSWDDLGPDLPMMLSFIDAEDSAGPFKLPVFEKA